MKCNLREFHEGAYKAFVHDGFAEFDGNGNLLRGNVSAQSEWSDNLFTEGGFARILTSSYLPITFVAGSSSTTPTESDTTLGSYLGKPHVSDPFVISSYSVSPSPDDEGMWVLEQIRKVTIRPGQLGAGPVNVSEVGLAMADALSVTSATALLSRGLLVDGMGDPTTVSMNAATEYLELFHRHRRYIPAEITGSCPKTIMGASGTMNYKLTPAYLDPAFTSGINIHEIWWRLNNAAASFSYVYPISDYPSYNTARHDMGVFTGSPVDSWNSIPSGTFVRAPSTVFTFQPYVPGSKQRSLRLQLHPNDANLSAIKTLSLNLGFQGWFIEFEDTIPKDGTPLRVLNIDVTISLANKP